MMPYIRLPTGPKSRKNQYIRKRMDELFVNELKRVPVNMLSFELPNDFSGEKASIRRSARIVKRTKRYFGKKRRMRRTRRMRRK